MNEDFVSLANPYNFRAKNTDHFSNKNEEEYNLYVEFLITKDIYEYIKSNILNDLNNKDSTNILGNSIVDQSLKQYLKLYLG